MCFPVIVYLPAIVTDTVRNDMQMFSVYVRVHIDQVRLAAVSELFHKLDGEADHLPLGQLVQGRRVERDMDNGFFDPFIEGRLVLEGFLAPFPVERPSGVLRNALRSEQPTFAVLDFDIVVSQHAVNIAAG